MLEHVPERHNIKRVVRERRFVERSLGDVHAQLAAAEFGEMAADLDALCLPPGILSRANEKTAGAADIEKLSLRHPVVEQPPRRAPERGDALGTLFQVSAVVDVGVSRF